MPFAQEGALAIRRDSGVGEIARGDDRELEVVVHHDVVLARGLQIAQYGAGAGHLPRRHEPVVFGRVLADRLAAERLLVAHVAIRRELLQRARDHVFRHRRRPHRLHQQGRHQHIAPEVRREIRQPRHHFLAIAQQFRPSDLALEATPAQRVRGVRAHAVVEALKVVVEDLFAGERGERGGVRGHPNAPAHHPPCRTPDGDDPAGDGGHRLPGVALEREPEVGLAVEARLLDCDVPYRIAALQVDPRREPGAQRLDGLHAEQCEVTRTLGRFQFRDMVDQLRELVLHEGGRVESE